MYKISRIANKVFYYILGISLLLGIAVFGFGIFKNLYLLVGYSFVYLIIPLFTLSLLTLLISNFKKFGFLSGIKESSVNIFALMLCSALIYFLQSFAFEKSNRINVKVINKTELGISNITLIGRNAMTKIDTLAPDENETKIFKGKRINYKTENDYENEIRLLYYFDNKWRENKILSGFSRWRVIDKDWEIKIHSADSIELKQK
ncbi:hypothetical protein SAMN04487989_1072 [Bizionia echini]|uniref:Uncharacterized protein n=1 Tax=Bizionia echini TaxID=649333 RepID=A0A1I5D5G2_9FLAO|nr:hypothetical protein [Bizionia echini]SFN94488.1 hypothetical protein SAMN04487989_1072 [Bizionia echini]